MKNIISRSNVKKLALEVSAQHRAGKFTRVSKDFLDRIEAITKRAIVSEVRRHPSVGKTLK
tara:strand:+ start:2066 stop:2248 length:183 start_codon:yes stop_codon:yes gene_type:complete